MAKVYLRAQDPEFCARNWATLPRLIKGNYDGQPVAVTQVGLTGTQTVGMPEREAMAHIGHGSKAVEGPGLIVFHSHRRQRLIKQLAGATLGWFNGVRL